MKALWLLLSISTYSFGQQPPIPYQDQQAQKGYFKELRMQLYEHHQRCPGIFKGLGILFIGVGIYQPILMSGSAIVASIAGLLAYTQEKDQDARQRKEDKDAMAYAFFANGPLEQIEKACQEDEYEESDTESLKKQNTVYLIHVLNEYARHYPHRNKINQAILNNYSAALDILKKNHADLNAALNYFTQKKPQNHFAVKWLHKKIST